MAACQQWKADIESGELDLKEVYWTDEKMFRLGAMPGANKNFVVYVKNTLKKSDVPNNLILRGDGNYQGGRSVLVSIGLCYRAVGALRFAPAKTKVN